MQQHLKYHFLQLSLSRVLPQRFHYSRQFLQLEFLSNTLFSFSTSFVILPSPFLSKMRKASRYSASWAAVKLDIVRFGEIATSHTGKEIPLMLK